MTAANAPAPHPDRAERLVALRAALADRILVLDGAMGTMVQSYDLDEAGFRGERFTDATHDLRGNNDLLILSRPEIVREIHLAYARAGADIIETNTFSSTAIAQADYGLEALAYELNRDGARIAREAAATVTAEDGRPRWVAGALGPTNRTASLSPDVNDPGFRNVDFEALRIAYREAARGLVDGGVDLLLLETIFDTLNAKAALFAIDELAAETGQRVPVMISGTITDAAGRTLSGQTVEAFWTSLEHVSPFTVGLNCSFGADQMRAYLADLARIADTLICAYPNAGLPNEFGEYDETPERTAAQLREWAQAGLLNIVGGCCGTTPAHIAALSAAVAGLPPRQVPASAPLLRLSGLEPFVLAATA